MPEERLQKILSAAGLASRRASEQMILDGRVSVNGVTLLTLGSKADPTRDDIRLDGRRVRPERLRYILLNKPEKVVTTRNDPQRRRTVMDLLRGVRESVYPVGRLDFDSAGLLLLTNDGDLAARLMHPRHGIEKVYRADVRGVPTEDQLARIEGGIDIDGQVTLPARVRLLKEIPSSRGEGLAILEITIHEGRNRQVRRMCEAIGHPVVRLTRVAVGPLRDKTLRSGEFRDLNAREIEMIKLAAADDAPVDRRR